MSDDVRADARRLLQGITPGEWVAEPWEGTTREAVGVFAGSVWGPRVAGLIESEADAEFIAAAPTLVERLLAELDRVGEVKEDVARRLMDAADSLSADYPPEIRVGGQGVTEAISRVRAERDAALATLQQVRARIDLAETWSRYLVPDHDGALIDADNVDTLLEDLTRMVAGGA
ncbi:hypothetical protein SEA_CLARK_61 [Gordonia phage Clark]|uniref:Uncharacterized protein n=2 Tax=Beenievirus TaxID=3044673 RepID=A0A4Y6EH02_9CAUD|nr:hypothetical protein PP507_gp61 [Gordonia phage Clark]YP_010654535.1 hypothetical protein PP508_gp62 [Gordonia phage Samman98]QDF18010.1 hypothetical protein SEA_CLARK_61 [Gordonia phage Clark]QYC54540.1 hypothetical protein SEA_SAMMAN98_62 [Gordonia phage Samman98]